MQQFVKRLTEARARAWEEAKALLDHVEAQKRDLTAAEDQTWQRLMADIDAKDRRIQELQAEERREAEGDRAREGWEGIVRPRTDRRSETLAESSFRSFLTGQSRERTLDVDLSAAAAESRAARMARDGKEMRDLLVGTAAAGGTLVPTTFSRELYSYLEQEAIVRSAGARVITTSSGEDLVLPTVASFGTAAIVGEGTALAEVDPTFSQVKLRSWKYGQLIQVSSELLADSSVSIESFLAEDTGRSLGRAVGAHYVSGAGTNQPLGVTTGAGTGVSGGTAVVGVPTGDNLIDLVHSLGAPYRQDACWLMNDQTVATVRKLKTSGGGDYIWQPSMQMGTPDRLLGYPLYSEPNIPAAGTGVMSVYFANLNRGYVIRDAASLRLERSDEYAFANDLVTFRAILRPMALPSTAGRFEGSRAQLAN